MNSKIREIVYTCDGDFPEKVQVVFYAEDGIFPNKVKDIIALFNDIIKRVPEHYRDLLEFEEDYDGRARVYYERPLTNLEQEARGSNQA